MIPQVDKATALKKAQRYCAYQERSQQEVRDKIYSWGLHKREVEDIIATLIDDGFLKESRFASAFAGGKFRIKSWGKNRIRQALKEKKVSEPLIRQALSEIDDKAYRSSLEKIISSYSKKVKEKNPLKKNYRVAAYAIRKGYEPELVWEVVKADESN
jgi:regulatory protein